MAALYDRALAGAERAGLADRRRRLISGASGRVLEVGAGTGLNLGHYGGGVDELILTEPDPHMAARLRDRLAAEPPAPAAVQVIETGAEELPFDDESFDAVVGTLVLCTVGDPARAIAEIRRVLVPGGQFIFLEHVRSESVPVARWQDRIERPWGLIAGGCHPNRATGDEIAHAGFWIETMDRGRMPKAPRLLRPMITGIARRPEPVAGARRP